MRKQLELLLGSWHEMLEGYPSMIFLLQSEAFLLISAENFTEDSFWFSSLFFRLAGIA